jgi:hypothetical protein
MENLFHKNEWGPFLHREIETVYENWASSFSKAKVYRLDDWFDSWKGPDIFTTLSRLALGSNQTVFPQGKVGGVWSRPLTSD